MSDRSPDPHRDARITLLLGELDIPEHGWPPYDDMHRQRIRAHARHGDAPDGSMEMKHADHPDWLPVLVELVGMVANEFRGHRHELLAGDKARSQLRAKLVEVGATTAAWVDAIDCAGATNGDPPACRKCGCTEEQACPGGCSWVPDPEGLGDLCSACLGGSESSS